MDYGSDEHATRLLNIRQGANGSHHQDRAVRLPGISNPRFCCRPLLWANVFLWALVAGLCWRLFFRPLVWFMVCNCYVLGSSRCQKNAAQSSVTATNHNRAFCKFLFKNTKEKSKGSAYLGCPLVVFATLVVFAILRSTV